MKKGAEYKKEVMGFDQAIFTFLDQCRQNLTHYVEIQKITAKLQRVRYMELITLNLYFVLSIQLGSSYSTFIG